MAASAQGFPCISPRAFWEPRIGRPGGGNTGRKKKMKPKGELQSLRARARALEARLSSMERRLRQMETGPAPLFRKATVNPGKCVGCGLCQAICPSGAMVVERTARVLADRCIGCGRCVEVCPEGAIAMGVPRIYYRRETGRSL